jgi:hypothetical protein
MRVPGSNLLKTALRVIGSTAVEWFQFQGQTTGPTGLVTSSYAESVTVEKGSVQPVPRDRYQQWGLDYAKSYVTWYVPNFDAKSITRDPNGNGDVIEWNNRRYQCIGDNPWFAIDGWNGVLCADIGPATGATNNA